MYSFFCVIVAKLSVTDRGSALLLGWTFLGVTILGFYWVLRALLGGEPLGRWGRHGDGAPISTGTATSILLLFAAVGGLFLYQGRVGGVPRWALHLSLGVTFIASITVPFVDEFRHRNH